MKALCFVENSVRCKIECIYTYLTFHKQQIAQQFVNILNCINCSLIFKYGLILY